MKPILAVLSILTVAILVLAAKGYAQTATITYTYDDLNRVTNVSYQGGTGQTFTPDEAGNITESTVMPAPVDSKGVSATDWAFLGTAQTCGCGIPDAWAFSNGLDFLDPNLASETPDNDGVTNLAKYQAYGNPEAINQSTRVGYTSLQAAYKDAQYGDTILIQSVQVSEDLTADRDITVTFDGGSDADLNASATTILGTVKVSSGTLIMNNCVVSN